MSEPVPCVVCGSRFVPSAGRPWCSVACEAAAVRGDSPKAEPRWTVTVRAEGYEARHAFTGTHAEASAKARWTREVSEMYATDAPRVLVLKCGRRFEQAAERAAERVVGEVADG